jgi:hypothetical protein
MDAAQIQIERPRMDVDIVCVEFDPAFGLRSQIATSKAQAFLRQGFAFSDPVTIA